MKVIYEGTDIYPKISINACTYDSYAADHADELNLTLNDTRKLWDKWSPQKGDRIAVELSAVRTGTMYVDTVKPLNGVYEIRAYSTPASMRENRNKSWESVRWLQLLGELADRNGLALKTYGLTERLYAYVEQRNRTDLDFLRERCALESCSFLVYDGNLIVFDERYMEAVEPVDTLKLSTVNDFSFKDGAGQMYGSCQLTNGGLTGSASCGTGQALVLPVPITFSDQSEADRFASGILRNRNRNKRILALKTSTLLKGYAAGSTLGLECESASSWNGQVFVHHIRFDLKRETTKVELRKPLEGY